MVCPMGSAFEHAVDVSRTAYFEGKSVFQEPDPGRWALLLPFSTENRRKVDFSARFLCVIPDETILICLGQPITDGIVNLTIDSQASAMLGAFRRFEGVRFAAIFPWRRLGVRD